MTNPLVGIWRGSKEAGRPPTSLGRNAPRRTKIEPRGCVVKSGSPLGKPSQLHGQLCEPQKK